MNKSNQSITFKGGPTTVTGNSVEEGQKAPNFKVTGNDMSDIELSNYKDKVLVSLDLPFAQKRYCAAEGIEAVKTASDYKHRTVGENYGTYFKEIGLLARGVFVIGKDGLVKHVEYVSEIAEEPNYEVALEAAKAAL